METEVAKRPVGIGTRVGPSDELAEAERLIILLEFQPQHMTEPDSSTAQKVFP